MRPWERHYPAGVGWDIALPPVTLPALLDAAAERFGDAVALEYGEARVTYRALGALVARVAGGLARVVRPGEAVAVLLPNTPWHPVAIAALARLGAPVVMMSLLEPPASLARKLRDSGARTLVTTDVEGGIATALALRQSGAVDRVLLGEDAAWGGAVAAWPAGAEPLLPDASTALPALPLPPAPDDVLLLQYTGGTTGDPRAAMLTHANITAAARIYQAWRDGDVRPGAERVIAALPLFHIFGLTVVLLANLVDGNTIILHPRFDAAAVLRDVGRGGATLFPAVPTMWQAILQHPEAVDTDWRSLRRTSCGGAPLAVELAAAVRRLTGVACTNGWGMTETAPAGCRVPEAVPMRPGLIGVPLPGVDLRIVALDDPASALAPGETGEIAVRGPTIFRGYWHAPEATASCFAAGWFLTGDVGRLDADGLITLLDRRRNMIISGGFKAYPALIEDAILAHPDVAEVIVTGVPDPYRGQSAKAWVRLRPGAATLTLPALRSFLADRLGRHELPRALELRSELPKSPAGKPLARLLTDAT